VDVDVVAGSVILHLALLVDFVLWTFISSLDETIFCLEIQRGLDE
jgi:hypothetical protein